MRLLIFIALISTAIAQDSPEKSNTHKCGEHGDCITVPEGCDKICGCDRVFYYNETVEDCVVNMTYIMKTIVEKYNTHEQIILEAEKVFNGIMISVILFMTCAGVCVFSACIYCFRINYSDYKLKSDVQALAKKLQRDQKFKKSLKKPTGPVTENCNVVVAEAGVFVV